MLTVHAHTHQYSPWMGSVLASVCDRAKQTPQGPDVHQATTASDIELIDRREHVMKSTWEREGGDGGGEGGEDKRKSNRSASFVFDQM